MDSKLILERLNEVFFYESQQRFKSLSSDARFSHYTSAEVAISIIENKQIWMRSASVMNDSSEFDYGFNALRDFWIRKDFLNLLAEVDDELLGLFNKIQVNRFGIKRDQVFLTCLSEHMPEDDPYGRLSMWRAYGGGNGVALILKPDFLDLNTWDYGLTTTPVCYAEVGELEQLFKELLQRMRNSMDFLQLIGPYEVIFQLHRAVQYSIMATKHPAFREEKEWRIIFEPGRPSVPFLKKGVAVINGVPQMVSKIDVGEDFFQKYSIGFEDIVDEILIGPSRYPEQIKLAIQHALKENGFERLSARVRCTGIPLVT